MTPRVKQDFRYDNNFRLISEAEDVYSYELVPSLNLTRKTERLELNADIEASFDRFSEEEFNSDNQRLTLSGTWLGARNSINSSVGLTRDSTLTSEEDDSGLGGVIGGASRRELAQFSTLWRHVLSQKLSLSVTGQYQDATYEAPFFNDFQYGFAQVSLTQTLTERTSVDYAVYGTWFGTEPIDIGGLFAISNATTTYAARVGLTHYFTPQLRGNLRVGFREAELRRDEVQRQLIVDPNDMSFFCIFFNICSQVLLTTEDRTSTEQDGLIGTAELTYTQELNEFTARFDLADRPSPQGLLEARTLTVNWRRQLRERLAFNLEVRAQQSEVIRGIGTQIDIAGFIDETLGFFARDFVRVSPRLQWRFAKDWAFGIGVQYRDQSAENPVRNLSGETIERNNDSLAVIVSLDYLPGRQLLN